MPSHLQKITTTQQQVSNMDSFSIQSLTSLCTSIGTRTASSAAEVEALTKSTDPAVSSDTLLAHRDHLTKLSCEASSLKDAVTIAAVISQDLQEALIGTLTKVDALVGKLHKQLMRLLPENVHSVDTACMLKFDQFLIAHIQVFGFLTEVLLVTDKAEQDARLLSSLGQATLLDAEKAFNQVTETTSILMDDTVSEKSSAISNSSHRSEQQWIDTDTEVDDEPPPYVAETPTTSPSSEAGPSSRNNASPFASLAKSFKALASQFASKPDPFVSALCHAIIHGDVQQVAGFLEQGANVNGRNEDGNTPLHCAIISDNEDALRLLLAAGANCKGSGWSGMPPLFQAASTGKLRVAKLLLDNGADINEQSTFSRQPYFVDVCGSGNLAGIELLLKNGAKTSWQSVSGRPVLVQAVRGDNTELVDLLLRYGADATVCDISGTSVLVLAAAKEDVTAARLLLDHGADPNSQAGWGTSVLGDAISAGRLEVSRLLLERGAGVNESGVYGQPLLICAIKSTKFKSEDKIDLVRRILQNSASTNPGDVTWDKAAICYALEDPLPLTAVVELLLKHGADSNNYKMSNGETLLLYAMDKGMKEEARLFLEHGANPNGIDSTGRAPLLQAVVSQNLDMVRLLRHHGASMDVKATVSVSDIAKVMNQPELLEALRL